MVEDFFSHLSGTPPGVDLTDQSHFLSSFCLSLMSYPVSGNQQLAVGVAAGGLVLVLVLVLVGFLIRRCWVQKAGK